MELVLVIAAMILFLTVKGFLDKKKARRRLEETISQQWGKLPEEEYTEEKFHSVQYYYKNKVLKKAEHTFYLDDITWHDLNMDKLFFMLNHTYSAMGEEVLWALLHEPELSKEPLLEREKLISFFQQKEKVRSILQFDFALIGKNKKISVYEYMDRMEQIRRESNLLHYIGIAGILGSLVLMFCQVMQAGVLLIGFLIFNLLTYYKRKGEIELYYSVISYLVRMIKHAENIAKEEISGLETYVCFLKQRTTNLKSFCKGAPALVPQNPTGDIWSLFLDYIRIIFHTDLIRFNKMMTQYFEKKEQIVEVFECIGFLDAMCAVASFRAWLNEYCLPEFTTEKQYMADTLYHPFLENPVPATIETRQSVLLTGSNASGKSTFIKSAALNAILAQTIHTVCAKSYRASFFKIFTSMALADNLFSGESYYIVEIKSLKRISDAITEETPVLCFVDEVLRGTNTVERIAASSRILYSIATTNALMFAATHDIELTYMLEECFKNYHFEERIENGQVLFDYQLKKGRAFSRNAIALLGMLGYPEEIIKKAEQTAQYFLDKGEWKAITMENEKGRKM